MTGTWHLTTVTLLLLIAFVPGNTAERRAWVTLTDCQHLSAKHNDGDSFRVRCGDSELNLRLYFVDAPEANFRYPERVREQSEYFGVTLDETMKAGAKARDAAQQMLRAPFIVTTRYASAAGRSRETRYYALVEVGGQGLAEQLVSQGLARTKGVFVNLPTGEQWKIYVERLQALEREARQKRLGIWASSPEQRAKSRPE
jgi:endonuclease YncB( thermonuclease family)